MENNRKAPTPAESTVDQASQVSPAPKRFATGELKNPPNDPPSVHDSKPIANNGALPTVDDSSWKAVLERIPRCAAAEGIRETSSFRSKTGSASCHGGRGGGGVHCLRKLMQELGSLNESLPCNPAIWLRFDDETPQFLRALITAPTGTPYALGLFAFDIFVPDAYPLVPPNLQLLTTGGGTVAFGPNLYANGKVCLSLLNTWSGPKWIPKHSTLLQVLVSIQGLLLGVQHPFYLEPGNGGWEGHVKEGADLPVPNFVQQHDQQIREGTVKYAMLETCKTGRPSFLRVFNDIIFAHFDLFRDAILDITQSWVDERNTTKTPARMRGSGNRSDECFHPMLNALGLSGTGQHFPIHAVRAGNTGQLESLVKKLRDALITLQGTTTDPPSASVASLSTHTNAPPLQSFVASTAASIAAKRSAIQEAAARGDFIEAGCLQSELKYTEETGVHAKIIAKRREMEAAAQKQDYITAGKLQEAVQALESNQARLEALESKMFRSAADHDFVRAGRFQEQYRALLGTGESGNPSAGASAAKASSSGSKDLSGSYYSAMFGPGGPFGMVGYAGSNPNPYGAASAASMGLVPYQDDAIDEEDETLLSPDVW